MTMVKMGSAVAALVLFLNAGASAAGEHAHEHQHGATPTQSPTGQKWQSDEWLRRAMGKVHHALTEALPQIRKGKYSNAQYAALAQGVRGEIAYMVENCKLPEAADAQLHLIIERMEEGAAAMAGGDKAAATGAGKVVVGVNDYLKRFDDPGLRPLRN